MTLEQLANAAQWLSGLATEHEKIGSLSVTLPTRTVRRMADALLAVVNRESA